MCLYSRMCTLSLKALPKRTLVRAHTYTYVPGTLEALEPGRKITVYRFRPWKYRSTCKICGAIDHGKQFHDYFITTPTCLFCGSSEHKLINTQADPLNKTHIVTQYSCPHLPHEEWPDLLAQLNNGYLKIQSCPRKFALSHGYQKSDVYKTILQLTTTDYGIMMGKRGLHEFYIEVLRLCDDEQRSVSFKRTITTTDEATDELEFLNHPTEL